MTQKDRLLTDVFSAIADPTRRALLARLTSGEATVSELAQPFRISLVAVSKHLKVLEKAGLIARKRQGREFRMRLTPAPMKKASAWMERYRIFRQQGLDPLE